MKQFILATVCAVFFLAPLTQATLEYYGIEDTITDDLSVKNVITLKFNETIPHLDYQFNFNIYDLVASSTFDRAECSIKEQNIISCDFFNMTPEKNQLTLSFFTKEGVKQVDGKYVFSANYGFLPTKKLFALIRLPQYSILSEEVANTSYFPAEGKIISDGKTIAVFWEKENIGEEHIQFSISYIFPQLSQILIISVAAIVIVAMVGLIMYSRRKQQAPVEVITSVLNQDEKIIVDILKREGKALQKALVRESNFSKAKVSRLVKDMKDRGIVKIEPVSGRENRVILSMGEKKENSPPLSP